jgi:hypothetical protein
MLFVSYKNWLNEKFVEDSDPIHDMGIGLYIKRNFDSIKDFHNWLYEYAPAILHIDNIINIIEEDPPPYMKSNAYDKLRNYCKKYITIEETPITTWIYVKEFRELIHEKNLEIKKK